MANTTTTTTTDKVIYSFGVATIKAAPNGAATKADILTFKEQVDGTETTMTMDRETAIFLAKGINGPVFAREGRSKSELKATFYLNFSVIQKLFPQNIDVDPTKKTFSVKSSISREIKPIQLDLRPVGETTADNCLYFPKVYPGFKENFAYDIDKPTQVEFTFDISSDATGIMYVLGKEITLP